MKHMVAISKKPVVASATTSVVDTLISFVIAVLNALEPILTAKEDTSAR